MTNESKDNTGAERQRRLEMKLRQHGDDLPHVTVAKAMQNISILQMQACDEIQHKGDWAAASQRFDEMRREIDLAREAANDIMDAGQHSS